MGRKGIDKVHQFIDDLVAVGVRELVGSGTVAEQEAREQMTAIAHQVCFQYARSHIYIPAVLELTLTPRDEQIYAAYAAEGPDGVRPYTAARLEQIAAEQTPPLTRRHCYNIIALAKRREQARRQPELPGLAVTLD